MPNEVEDDVNEITDSGFVISDGLYKKLKFLVQVVLPAFSTLYFTLGNVYHWDNVEQVIGTLAAVATFVGVVLGITSKNYNNSDLPFAGTIHITESPEGVKTYSLIMNGDPEDIDTLTDVKFKVAGQ